MNKNDCRWIVGCVLAVMGIAGAILELPGLAYTRHEGFIMMMVPLMVVLGGVYYKTHGLPLAIICDLTMVMEVINLLEPNHAHSARRAHQLYKIGF